MHKYFEIYYFIDDFNIENLKNLPKKISIIYRDHHVKPKLSKVLLIRDFCRKNNIKFFIANDFKFALKVKCNGVYISGFKKILNLKNLNLPLDFEILGSAHNIPEIKIKENQGCSKIFISPIFKTNKRYYFLGITRFNILSLATNKSIIALGGINENNFKKIKITKSIGLASISWIKKNGPRKLGPLI